MKLLATITLFSLFAFPDINIVTSDKNPLKNVTLEKLANVYLKKTDNIDGIKVVPIDNKDSYDEFCKKVIKKTPKQLRAYWMKEIYRGDKQPPPKLSPSEIKKRIEENPKVISYTSSKLTGKILFTIR
jgi:hypothetical protein